MQDMAIQLAAGPDGTVVATGGGNGATWTHIAAAAEVVEPRGASSLPREITGVPVRVEVVGEIRKRTH